MKRIFGPLALVVFALLLAGCDLSVAKTDSQDPIQAGRLLTYTVTPDMVESELPAPNSASEVSPELRSMDTSRAFAEGMPFPPIQSPPEGFAGSGSPTFIVQDTLPASVNFVSVRPVGPNADGVICSDPDAQRRIFCLYNPFSTSDSESEELAQIKITVRTTKPGLIKNTARIGTGLIGLTSS